jgi:hypothetical protein
LKTKKQQIATTVFNYSNPKFGPTPQYLKEEKGRRKANQNDNTMH